MERKFHYSGHLNGALQKGKRDKMNLQRTEKTNCIATIFSRGENPEILITRLESEFSLNSEIVLSLFSGKPTFLRFSDPYGIEKFKHCLNAYGAVFRIEQLWTA